MKVLYVAGPFRALNSWDVEANVRSAEALALELWRRGFAVICPHTNTRFYQGALPDYVWLEGDLEILRRCDGVVLAEGWESSAGTLAEIEMAKSLNIPVWKGLEEFDDARRV